MSVVDGPHAVATRDPVLTAAPDRRRTSQAPWVDAEPPVKQVLVVGASALLAAAFLEILLLDTVGVLVGLCLVAVSVGTALTVRPRDLFSAGVLPPLLLVGLLTVVAVLYPGGIDVSRLSASASIAQRVIAGFVDLAGALVVAHALALLVVALRVRVTRLRRRRDAGTPPPVS